MCEKHEGLKCFECHHFLAEHKGRSCDVVTIAGRDELACSCEGFEPFTIGKVEEWLHSHVYHGAEKSVMIVRFLLEKIHEQ